MNKKTRKQIHFLKAMRRKKSKRGGSGWWPLSILTPSKPDDNKNEIERAENLDQALDVAKGVAGAIVAVELLTNAAEPLLAASGVGIPLLAIIIVAKKLAKQYKQNLQLNAVLSDVIIIIENCYFLEALIKKTMMEFKEPLEKALIEEGTNINKVDTTVNGGGLAPRTNDSIETSIKIKLDGLNKLLQKISPEEKETKFQSMTKKFRRFFFSAELRNEIIVSLTVINGLFAIYNSQFEWSIKYYESKIINNLENGNEEIKNIWKNIENSEEYIKYLFQNESNIDEIIKNAQERPDISQAIDKEITSNAPKADEQLLPEQDKPLPLDKTLTGGNYKRKTFKPQRYKKIVTYKLKRRV